MKAGVARHVEQMVGTLAIFSHMVDELEPMLAAKVVVSESPDEVLKAIADVDRMKQVCSTALNGTASIFIHAMKGGAVSKDDLLDMDLLNEMTPDERIAAVFGIGSEVVKDLKDTMSKAKEGSA